MQQCKTLIDQEQLGMAYVQYLRASEITVNIIPRHSDYRSTVHQRPGWYDQFSDLMLVSQHLEHQNFKRPSLWFVP